ncbi:MAG TPA: serine/threonine-protein kinase, partial [Gemmatimonadaceae bacterium]|nr:serine/threonine-protein kinase [Gemmatimonadaceae bacterium]
MDELFCRVRRALGERYELTREIGGGGMSRVFLARERHPDRPVVVKVLPPDVADDAAARRFHHEIAVTARLQHPHVLPVLAAGDVDGLAYFVTPFLEGESLRHRLVGRGRLPIPEAVRVLHELGDALAYAHRHGVVHRDVKPENVLVHDGHAVLADFGSALLTGSGASVDRTLCVAMGTPGYMAPEQAAGDPALDARADVYSLGVLAYELLTGAPPFARPTPRAVLVAHLRETAIPVERIRADTPAALARLVGRALAKDPAHRPRSAVEFQAALSVVRPTAAQRAATAPASTATFRSRHWAASGAVAVLAAVALVGAARHLSPAPPTPPPPPAAEPRQVLAP